MNDKQNTCCFSGHRPGGLPFGHDEKHPDCILLKMRLLEEMVGMRGRGVTTFLSGMAQGTDLIAAEIALNLKWADPSLPVRLVAVIPHEGQADRWTVPCRERYFKILSEADEVITLHKQYTASCMHERNRYMVDASSYLIAVFGGAPGGTKYTVDYAVKKGLDVVIFDPVTLKRRHIPSSLPYPAVP
ncbi:SLOG family protein [Papillibacter cinnamivorans]|uniref:Uncharacterized SPBc2 prophage-derived protein YoqJ n=1 Tax=Papillibacter cinnamivorans DSM 12816 TaxID=1122930 RepID=A0A1W2C9H7_9FIRM|nr:SLOG family protein [Papillibacter cinnamivorans]SMC81820.1 Uncharacterized SPBc2 prophage-derived protein YoqJ [Papillibacter cinnamivorans DSM 12816]